MKEKTGVLDEGAVRLRPEAFPNVVYDRAVQIQDSGASLKIAHYPAAHTNSDSVVFVENKNAVYLGDLFTNGYFPFLDIQQGRDFRAWASRLKIILKEMDEKTVAVPGHGPRGNKKELIGFVDMLDESMAVIAEKKKQGNPLEEIMEQPLKKDLQKWARDEDHKREWLRNLWRSLEKPLH